jgi:hypothetical protein
MHSKSGGIKAPARCWRYEEQKLASKNQSANQTDKEGSGNLAGRLLDFFDE